MWTHRVVNAAGAWAQEVQRMLGSYLPIDAIVGQRLVVQATSVLMPYLINHVWDDLSLKEHENGRIMVGGGWLGTGDLSTAKKNAIRENIIGNLSLANQVIPALHDVRLLHVQLGWDASTPDRLPLCGPVAGVENAFILHGSRRGYSLGPLLAKGMADIIVGEAPTESVRAFDPSRLMGPSPTTHPPSPSKTEFNLL